MACVKCEDGLSGDQQQQEPQQQQRHPRQTGAAFRGLAAVARSGARSLQAARPLAFSSEVGVAANSMLPRPVYYGSWALSGLAVVADAGLNVADAPDGKRPQMALLQTAFHVPASLVLPAMIIHKVVRAAEDAVHKLPRLAEQPLLPLPLS